MVTVKYVKNMKNREFFLNKIFLWDRAYHAATSHGGECRRHEAFLGGYGGIPPGKFLKNEGRRCILGPFRDLIWEYFIILISYILCQKNHIDRL